LYINCCPIIFLDLILIKNWVYYVSSLYSHNLKCWLIFLLSSCKIDILNS
jgi:hypothetical protein